MNHRDDVWLDGVEDYIGHAKSLLVEAADSDSPVSGLKDSPSQAGTAFDGPLSKLIALTTNTMPLGSKT